VIKANQREVVRSNPPEPHQIIDIGKLEGAVERPRSAWGYGVEDLVELAVSMFEGIAHAHAFIQGNKRTAWKASVLFLKANGAAVDPTIDGEVFGRFLTRFVAGEIAKEDVVAAIRSGIVSYNQTPRTNPSTP
jgi:death-on-curing protein